MSRKLTDNEKKAKQLAIYLKQTINADYYFIADVVNREFKTDFKPEQCKGFNDKFRISGKQMKTDLIPEFMPDYPPTPNVEV